MPDTLAHHPVCCCFACLTPASSSDSQTPDPPGNANATKPVYSPAQIINALRTADSAYATIAWAGQQLEYSIGTGAVGPGQAGYRSEYGGYTAMTEGMRARARETFELWDDLIAIDLVEVAGDPTADMVFNYSSATQGNGTYASYQYGGSAGGRAVFGIDAAWMWFSDNWWTHDQEQDLYDGGYGILTYLHEIGHALGLSHPGLYDRSGSYSADATHFQDTRAYTVMSYFNAGANGSGADHDQGGLRYAATPLLHDILAIQAVYGADQTTRTGNDVYGFNSNVDRDAFDFTRNIHPVVAIWDAAGNDKIDASGWSTDQVLDLTQGAFSSLGYLTDNVAIAYGAVIEIGTTGDGNDRLVGNAANNVLTGNGGADTLIAGDGDDVLFGGAGGDVIDGGDGADWLRYGDALAGISANLQSGTGTAGDADGDVITGIEHLSGSEFADTITGDNIRSNQLFGLGGDDLIDGGSGNDFLLGQEGNDSLYGGNGRDILRGGPGADLLDGGVSLDWAQYNDAASGIVLDMIGGGTGGDAAGDLLVDIENVLGSAFGDTILGTGIRNLIMAGDGDDRIEGRAGPDVLMGEGGDDTILGGDDQDTIEGGPGADTLDGGANWDWVRYFDSSEGVAVDLMTGAGSAGDAAGDLLVDIEWIWGSAYDDTLTGDDGVNMIRGGQGDDTITGRAGNDILEGHGGADVFRFAEGDGIDRIHGFEIGIDLINVVDSVTGFGQLSISDFRGEAAIAYDTGDVILLTGIAAAVITSDMFVFG